MFSLQIFNPDRFMFIEVLSRIKNFLVYTVFFVLSCFIGFFVGKMAVNAEANADLDMLQIVSRAASVGVFLVLSIFLHIFVHEAGHMLAALSRGWSFMSFMMAGIVLSRKNGRFRLSRYSLSGAGGQCLMLPPEKGDTDAGIVFYNVGGILANATVTVSASFALYEFHSSFSFYGTAFLWLVVLLGLFFVLVNGIPHRLSGLPNDGMNVANLRKDRFSTFVFLNSLRMLGFLMSGDTARFRSMSYMCDGKEINPSNNIHVMAVSMDISLALANMDFNKARAIIGRINPYSDKIVQIYRNEFTLERIFLTLTSPHRKSEIEHLLTPSVRKYIKSQGVFRPSVVRVQYALAKLHYHNENEAARIYEHFENVCRHYYIAGESEIERTLVEYVRRYKDLDFDGDAVEL